MPALNPDVTILHAQRADQEGNVAIEGIVGAQREAALAARCLVVTVEEIVDALPPAMNGVVLPHWLVSAVALCPGGAYPSYAHGYYARDNAFYQRWDDIARDRDAFLAWIERHVMGTARSRRLPAEPEGSRVSDYTRDEMMTVAAARLLWDGCVCFVGIGLPSAACNLARLTHAPGVVLIYESGTIGTRPEVLPLSIGDGELAETAACVVPLPEVFSYYLQAGRVDVGFLGAAQIDRYGNLNSTVIGPYDRPATRLPGAGGAPEIASHARQTFVVMKATRRSFVPRLDFCTSAGFLDGTRRARAKRCEGRRAACGDHGRRHTHAPAWDRRTCALGHVSGHTDRGGVRGRGLAARDPRVSGHRPASDARGALGSSGAACAHGRGTRAAGSHSEQEFQRCRPSRKPPRLTFTSRPSCPDPRRGR